MDWLKNIDTQLFLFINNHNCAFCDFIFYWASDKLIWIPFYLFLVFILFKKFGAEIWKIVLAVAILILLSDQLSVFVKDHVMRYRPCHNLILQSQIHLVNNYCGGQYGFVSSHAANSFALISFLILLVGRKTKWITGLLISWCFLVSYSRIYLGTHYPSDILGGWLLGVILTYMIFYIYRKFWRHDKN